MNTTNPFNPYHTSSTAVQYVHDAIGSFHKIPGSAIVIRYIRSSYQNDPVRSAVELFLILFAVYYLLAPAYSTTKKSNVRLSESVRISKRHRRSLGLRLYRR